MSLNVNTKVPYGNAAGVSVVTDGEMPEIRFAADPHGGPECLWFCFQIKENDEKAPHDGKLKLTLANFVNVLGAGSAVDCVPVYRPSGQGWYRMSTGTPTLEPDGRTLVSWQIPYPEPVTDIAFCFPYGPADLRSLLAKSKGYWKNDTIGVSQSGRPLKRLANDYGDKDGKRHGLYLIARQHAGETPGSWVLDGLLRYFAKVRKDPFLIWAIPLADVDGVMYGDYGKDQFPYDLNRAWGNPPMRHETLVYKRDVARWRERCQPTLAIDFHAPGACETKGIYAFLPSPDHAPEMHREAEKWANVMQQELADYAAQDFKRVVTYASRWETPMFTRFVTEELGVCALSIETPYAKIGTTVLSPKHYREAGERIAHALVQRGH